MNPDGGCGNGSHTQVKAMGVITNPVLLWLMSVLEWVSYRSADRLVDLFPGIVEGFEARGVDRSRIAMEPNGCDMDLFSTPEAAQRCAG